MNIQEAKNILQNPNRYSTSKIQEAKRFLENLKRNNSSSSKYSSTTYESYESTPVDTTWINDLLDTTISFGSSDSYSTDTSTPSSYEPTSCDPSPSYDSSSYSPDCGSSNFGE